jgi:hypothetical protein
MPYPAHPWFGAGIMSSSKLMWRLFCFCVICHWLPAGWHSLPSGTYPLLSVTRPGGRLPVWLRFLNRISSSPMWLLIEDTEVLSVPSNIALAYTDRRRYLRYKTSFSFLLSGTATKSLDIAFPDIRVSYSGTSRCLFFFCSWTFWR